MNVSNWRKHCCYWSKYSCQKREVEVTVLRVYLEILRSRWLDVGQEWGQYPATLTEQAWPIKNVLYGFRENFSFETVSSPKRERKRHLASSGSHSQHMFWVIFPAHEASNITIWEMEEWNKRNSLRMETRYEAELRAVRMTISKRLWLKLTASSSH